MCSIFNWIANGEVNLIHMKYECLKNGRWWTVNRGHTISFLKAIFFYFFFFFYIFFFFAAIVQCIDPKGDQLSCWHSRLITDPVCVRKMCVRCEIVEDGMRNLKSTVIGSFGWIIFGFSSRNCNPSTRIRLMWNS